MTWGLITLGICAIIIAILPARYDPAIRLKEWIKRRT
jgi:hypothetical protein